MSLFSFIIGVTINFVLSKIYLLSCYCKKILHSPTQSECKLDYFFLII